MHPTKQARLVDLEMTSGNDSTVMEMGWKDARKFEYIEHGGIHVRADINSWLASVKEGLKEMGRAEPLPNVYNDKSIAKAFYDALAGLRTKTIDGFDRIVERYAITMKQKPVEQEPERG
ncbi:hypothetical protein BGZ54_003959 [Gamsiella multidivaricata]|nr:hypothetical protein BGZ54_003959 [Gamsiella multidivaricata]